MSKAEYRQLTFAFADSPQGDGQSAPSDVSVGKDWLALIAKAKEGTDSAAWTVDPSRLLESAASLANLAQALLNRYAQEFGRPVRGFAPEALQAIEHYPWPGNVRELENRIKSAVVMSDSRLLTAAELGLAAPAGEGAFFTLREVRSEAERKAILHALAVCDGNVSAASARLGVSRPTLYDLMERLGISEAKSARDE